MLLDLIGLNSKYDMKIKGVIHIGAHTGQENKVYEQLSIPHRIFFEPLESNFSRLSQNIGQDHILIQRALGNENKTIEMWVETANGGQSSSILEPSLHLVQYPHIQFPKKEEVQMSRLDDLDLDLSPYNFINIDVQGYEMEVFKGAQKKLETVDYIMTELNRAELYSGCARIEEVEEYLSQFGFELVEISWEGVTWGDGLFIKNK